MHPRSAFFLFVVFLERICPGAIMHRTAIIRFFSLILRCIHVDVPGSQLADRIYQCVEYLTNSLLRPFESFHVFLQVSTVLDTGKFVWSSESSVSWIWHGHDHRRMSATMQRSFPIVLSHTCAACLAPPLWLPTWHPPNDKYQSMFKALVYIHK